MKARATRFLSKPNSLLVKTGFSNYDIAMNPYVGCEFGCTYCYVRFFIKDDTHEWGDFVRVRDFVDDKLPKELRKGYVKIKTGTRRVKDEETGKTKSVPVHVHMKIQDARLVLGTMTDPYQPAEREFRVTRRMLTTLLREDLPHFKKVGIFTRSPIVLEDLDLIKRLPDPRVHFTVTPFPPNAMRALEPISSRTDRRWRTVQALKEAGLRVHCNISPVIPLLSEQYIEEFVGKLTELQIDEYFVDPVQPYGESLAAMTEACKDRTDLNWSVIEEILKDKERYLGWKAEFLLKWNEAREKVQDNAPNQTPIWCDHENKVWVDMRTMTQMDWKDY